MLELHVPLSVLPHCRGTSVCNEGEQTVWIGVVCVLLAVLSVTRRCGMCTFGCVECDSQVCYVYFWLC